MLKTKEIPELFRSLLASGDQWPRGGAHMEPRVHGHAAATMYPRGVALHVQHVTVDSSPRKQLHYAGYPERNAGQ